MLSIEKYKSKEIDRIYREVYIDTAISNQAQIFEEMIKQGYMRKADPKIMALQFFAPIFLLLNRYDGIAEKEGFDLAVEEVNRGGKIHFDVEMADTKGNIQQAVSAAQKMISDKKVISDKNRPLLIIDAKYKNEWENVASNKSDKPEREDCFQIMSYMYRAECKFGGIFCPQTKVRDERVFYFW